MRRDIEMESILEEIQNGQFAKEWILENMAGRPVYNAYEEKGQRASHRADRRKAALDDELDREKGLIRMPVAKEGLLFILPSLLLSLLCYVLHFSRRRASSVPPLLFLPLFLQKPRTVGCERRRRAYSPRRTDTSWGWRTLSRGSFSGRRSGG